MVISVTTSVPDVEATIGQILVALLVAVVQRQAQLAGALAAPLVGDAVLDGLIHSSVDGAEGSGV
jgi:hypothetical protein